MFPCFALLAASLLATPSRPGQTSDAPWPILALPFSRGNKVFTTRTGPQGRAVFCVQEGLDGKPKILIDSADDPIIATYPLSDFSVSEDGRYVAHFVKQADEGYEEIPIVDTKTGKVTSDKIQWTHVSDFGWRGKGFYYAVYPDRTPIPVGHPRSAYKHEQIMFHRLGTPQSADQPIYQNPAVPDGKLLFLTTYDQKWLLIHELVQRNGQRVRSEYFIATRSHKTIAYIDPPTAGETYLVDAVGGKLLLYTTYKYPKGRLILVDPKHPEEANWKTLQLGPPAGDAIQDGEPLLGKICIVCPDPAGGSKAYLYDRNGKFLNQIPTDPGTTVDVEFCGPKEHWAFLSVQKGKEPKRYFAYFGESNKLVPMH